MAEEGIEALLHGQEAVYVRCADVPCGRVMEEPVLESYGQSETRNKCIASSNKCLTSSNKKLRSGSWPYY